MGITNIHILIDPEAKNRDNGRRMTLNHVKLVSLMKYSYPGIRVGDLYTFQVETNEGDVFRIRIEPDKFLSAEKDLVGAFGRVDIVKHIRELGQQNCFVDLEVESVDWVIRDMSGTSLILREIKHVYEVS